MSTSMQHTPNTDLSVRTQMADRSKPLYRTALGYRLGVRHRLAWRLADFSRWLQDWASMTRERAAWMSDGEIRPSLSIYVDQLEVVARSMGIKTSDLVEQMDMDVLTKGGTRPTRRPEGDR